MGITVSTWPRKPNPWIQEEVKTASLFERLMKLVEVGNAFAVLPGGSGTLFELACVLELVNKRVIDRKPIVLVGDFWDGVLATLRNEPPSANRSDCTLFVHKVEGAEELAGYLKASLATR